MKKKIISVTMSNSPYNCLTSSFVLLLQYPATHIGPNIFLSNSFPKYANFSHHLPLNTVLLSHTAALVLLFCTFLFLLSWIRLLISMGAILCNNSYFRALFLLLSLCYHYFLLSVTLSKVKA